MPRKNKPKPPLEILGAIKNDPGNKALRIQLAEWFESNGQSERGELIRLQFEAAGMSDDDDRYLDMVLRNQEVLATHAAAWLGPFRKILQKGMWQIEMGLLRITVESRKTTKNLVEKIDADFWPWVEGISLDFRGDREAPATEQAEALGSLLTVASVTTLSLYGSNLESAGVAAMSNLPDLRTVTDLNLDMNATGTAGAVALAASPYVSHLASLSLVSEEIGDEGITAIAKSPNMRALKVLALDGNKIGPAGTKAIAVSTGLKGLVALRLGSNEIGDEGALAIAKSEKLKGLKSLHLYENQISDVGAVALAESANLDGLAELRLYDNPIGAKGVAALKKRFGDVIAGSLGD